MKNNNIAAIILSGGAGNRLGGADKGLQSYNGQTLIERVITRIAPQVEKTIISANRNIKQYQLLNLDIIEDSNSQSSKESVFNGPLAGIIAGIQYLKEKGFKRLLIAPCDVPNIPNDYVTRLEKSLNDSNANVAVVNDGMRNQNLHCLIDRSVINDLVAFYGNGGRAMHRWLKQVETIEVDFSAQANCFLNINSKEQLTKTE